MIATGTWDSASFGQVLNHLAERAGVTINYRKYNDWHSLPELEEKEGHIYVLGFTRPETVPGEGLVHKEGSIYALSEDIDAKAYRWPFNLTLRMLKELEEEIIDPQMFRPEDVEVFFNKVKETKKSFVTQSQRGLKRIQAQLSQQEESHKKLTDDLDKIKEIIETANTAKALENMVPSMFSRMELGKNSLIFYTHPITLSHEETRYDLQMDYEDEDEANEKVEFEVELGRLKLCLEVEDGHFACRVRPYKGNVYETYDSRYYHPHVQEDGNPCFGDAEQAAIDAKANMDLPALLAIAHSILHNYSPQNPFRSLKWFYFATKE